MLIAYDSYPPDKRDLSEKEEALGFRRKPVKKDEGDIPYSKYMDSRPFHNRPFKKLLAKWEMN